MKRESEKPVDQGSEYTWRVHRNQDSRHILILRRERLAPRVVVETAAIAWRNQTDLYRASLERIFLRGRKISGRVLRDGCWTRSWYALVTLRSSWEISEALSWALLCITPFRWFQKSQDTSHIFLITEISHLRPVRRERIELKKSCWILAHYWDIHP